MVNCCSWPSFWSLFSCLWELGFSLSMKDGMVVWVVFGCEVIVVVWVWVVWGSLQVRLRSYSVGCAVGTVC